jgi:hypothetical protein
MHFKDAQGVLRDIGPQAMFGKRISVGSRHLEFTGSVSAVVVKKDFITLSLDSGQTVSIAYPQYASCFTDGARGKDCLRLSFRYCVSGKDTNGLHQFNEKVEVEI